MNDHINPIIRFCQNNLNDTYEMAGYVETTVRMSQSAAYMYAFINGTICNATTISICTTWNINDVNVLQDHKTVIVVKIHPISHKAKSFFVGLNGYFN